MSQVMQKRNQIMKTTLKKTWTSTLQKLLKGLCTLNTSVTNWPRSMRTSKTLKTWHQQKALLRKIPLILSKTSDEESLPRPQTGLVKVTTISAKACLELQSLKPENFPFNQRSILHDKATLLKRSTWIKLKPNSCKPVLASTTSLNSHQKAHSRISKTQNFGVTNPPKPTSTNPFPRLLQSSSSDEPWLEAPIRLKTTNAWRTFSGSGTTDLISSNPFARTTSSRMAGREGRRKRSSRQAHRNWRRVAFAPALPWRRQPDQQAWKRHARCDRRPFDPQHWR